MASPLAARQIMQRSEDYSKLSEDILNVDSRILAVDIVDYSGDFLARAIRPTVKDVLGADRNLARRWAAWSTLLVGLSKQFDDVLSETEFIVIGRKNFKRLLIPLPARDIVVSLVLVRSTETSEINDRIRSFIMPSSHNS